MSRKTTILYKINRFPELPDGQQTEAIKALVDEEKNPMKTQLSSERRAVYSLITGVWQQPIATLKRPLSCLAAASV